MRPPAQTRAQRTTPLDQQEQLARIEGLTTETAFTLQKMRYARIRIIISVLVATGAVLSGAAAVEALFHRQPPAPVYIFLNAPPRDVI